MKKKLLRFLLYLIAVLFCIPVLYVIYTSFLTEDGIGLVQYRTLMKSYPSYFSALKNSLFYAVTITAGGILISIPVAYLFAKVRFKGRNTLFFIYVVVMMLPVQSTILGQYLLMQGLGWLDHKRAVIFPMMLSPLTVFLLRQNMKSISEELVDATRLETNSVFVLLFRVILPQIRSIIWAAAVLLFCESWNIIEQAMILLPRNEALKPLSVMMERYPEEIRSACEAIYLSPVIIILLFLALSQLCRGRQRLNYKNYAGKTK